MKVNSRKQGVADHATTARKQVSRSVRRHASTLLLLFVLAVEAGLGVLVVRDQHTGYSQVERIYMGSVRGLRQIGELQYEIQEARRTAVYALTTQDANLQVVNAHQSRQADRIVSDRISEYLAGAQTAQQREAGKRLAADWPAYLKVRDDVLGLILEGRAKEAVTLDLSSGVALFDRVRQDLEEVKRRYDEQASQQLVLVVGSSQRAIFKLIGGFVFALLFATAAIWAIQRNRMRAEMRLAKLQMDFVASISHELRTPISAIICAGENIRDGSVPARDDLAEQGSIIVDQASNLAALVDDVLLFAMTTVRPAYTLHPLQVPDIIANALKNTSGLLQKSEFTVELNVPEGLPEIMGDLPAISRCLQNLIANAVKYGREARQIHISAALADLPNNRQEVRLSVRDGGRGISSSDLPLIFQPFFRSPEVVAAQIEGTGLGLSIAKSMIEALGGRLSVISELGVGSTFTLHLPTGMQDPSSGSVRPATVARKLAT